MSTVEQVVLLDEGGRAQGAADKATVHHQSTPLHLAFSCYVFNDNNEVLLTRRALTKKTWPGEWTNSCCGHPSPGESMERAVLRRLSSELGLIGSAPELILPSFRYRAVMDNGVVENEMCPVYRVWSTQRPNPAADEVDSVCWMEWPVFASYVADGQLRISPWCREQIAQLRLLGEDVRRWPVGSATELPPAARAAG